MQVHGATRLGPREYSRRSPPSPVRTAFQPEHEWTTTKRRQSKCRRGPQGDAVLAAGDRTEALSELAMPARVVRGTRDPLIPFEDGLRVHRAIRSSRMLALGGVGHDLPHSHAERVLEAVVKLAGS